MSGWTQPEAIALCRQIEAVCPAHGCHVALTGGLLYKLGERKDLDLVFYRIRQVSEIDIAGMFAALAAIGIEVGGPITTRPFVVKATWRGRPIDCLFPEAGAGDYAADAAAVAAPVDASNANDLEIPL